MDLFLQKTPMEQRLFVQEAAARTGMVPLVLEKDYWVCWMLGQLFSLPEIGEHLTFKGGTSLSKVYGVIQRFSEDIDLAIHRDHLGFGGDEEPEEAGSNKERKRRLEALSDACTVTVREKILPALREQFPRALIGDPELIELATDDPQTLLFYYPRCLEDHPDYIRPFVKMEFGARSDDWPLEKRSVVSYLEREFELQLLPQERRVNVLSAERTFWEKATILHAEYHRPPEKELPDRQSRHYYDLHCLAASDVGGRAIKKLDLLARVAQHKSIFFRSGWAKYDEAKPGTLKLVPTDGRVAALRNDYDAMREMFFEEPPVFSEILGTLTNLEQRINGGETN